MLKFRHLKKLKSTNDITHIWCDKVKYLSLLSWMLSPLSMDDWLSFVCWCECLVRWWGVSLCQPLQSKSVWISAEKEKAARNLSAHFTSKRGSRHKINYLHSLSIIVIPYSNRELWNKLQTLQVLLTDWEWSFD